ncbi:MAG: hypothetical protein Q4C10_05650 [Clostridia bacterium]|nr:hypothetical protein [Clostridia bacterium]
MIVLQELLFPDMETCPNFDMYFRADADRKHAYADPEAESIVVPQWCTLDLDTFFNSFSIGKWVTYTRLENLRLRLELSGTFRVQLIHWQRLRGKCEKTVVVERVCRAEGRQAFDLSFPEALAPRGIYAASLYAVSEGCAFYGGGYATDVDADTLNEVNIALDICTYRREEAVARNLAVLNRDILERPGCELGAHLEAFVSDNGQTLDPSLATDKIHLFPNRNVGGAGGFTRGMIEIIDHPKSFSHVLVMDDDVILNTDAIARTYWLLRLLKPEYAGKTVAGALMRLDKRYKQYENGALMNSYILKPVKYGLDMRKIDCVLRNEQEETIHYNGWWYSCIPMSKISDDSLPLPVFVHRDDVEFGLRTGSDILTLNGVCLWHESFDNKFAASMEYYEVRNDLIVNALHRPDIPAWRLAWQLMHRTVGNAIRYRYNNCDLMFRGFDDFMAGPERLIQTDPTALHREILGMSQKMRPLSELQKEIPFRDKPHRKGIKKRAGRLNTLRIYLLNGLFLPSKGTNIVNIATPWPRNFYRRSAILNYDELNQMGFITQRSIGKTLSALWQSAKRSFILVRKYGAVSQAWREAQPTLTSRPFWTEYLGLNQ